MNTDTKEKAKIEGKCDYYQLEISINGLPHIIFPIHKKVAFQSWYEGTEKEGRIYKFELDNGEINSEYHYDNFDTWKEIILLIRKFV